MLAHRQLTWHFDFTCSCTFSSSFLIHVFACFWVCGAVCFKLVHRLGKTHDNETRRTSAFTSGAESPEVRPANMMEPNSSTDTIPGAAGLVVVGTACDSRNIFLLRAFRCFELKLSGLLKDSNIFETAKVAINGALS